MQRRTTSSTTAVLELLRSAGGALSHEMIEARLSAPINRSTVYRILNRFVEDGLVHRVVAADGRQYFAPCRGCAPERHVHDHPHFHCISCERVECLSQEVEIRLPQGYRSAEFNATVSGYCSDCNPPTK